MVSALVFLSGLCAALLPYLQQSHGWQLMPERIKLVALLSKIRIVLIDERPCDYAMYMNVDAYPI